MTRDEMATLLGLMAARDGRAVGRIEVEAWFEDAGHWDFATARAAVARHYRDPATSYAPPTCSQPSVRSATTASTAPEMPVPNASPDDPAGYAVEYRALRLAIADGTLARRPPRGPTAAARSGLTGRPVLTGPMSPPNPDTGPAIVREASRSASSWPTSPAMPPSARGRGRPAGPRKPSAPPLEALSQFRTKPQPRVRIPTP